MFRVGKIVYDQKKRPALFVLLVLILATAITYKKSEDEIVPLHPDKFKVHIS